MFIASKLKILIIVLIETLSSSYQLSTKQSLDCITFQNIDHKERSSSQVMLRRCILNLKYF